MKHMKKIIAGVIVVFATLMLSSAASARGILDIPVAEPTNRLYFADMPTRLWWNADWTKRTPFLVSNVSKVRVADAPVDIVVDLGEKVDPKEIRVVTPWETEVPSCAWANGDKVEIVFLTELRELENKMFFIYWGNKKAEASRPFSLLGVRSDGGETRLSNGAIDIIFDDRHQTEGLIKSIRVAGSPARNELLWRTTGYAWEGFSFKAGGKDQGEWSKGEVVVDMPLRKTVRYTCKTAELDFTLYANATRLDWSYRLAKGVNNATVGVSWAAGGGCTADDLYYTGTAGKVLTMRAALDCVTDCIPNPLYHGFPWISEGWYAIRDRKTHDTVGLVFDRAGVTCFSYLGAGQHTGENMSFGLQSCVGVRKDEIASGAGALVARVGEWQDVQREHAFLKGRPRVFLGETQDYAPIAPKVPRLHRDFCVNVNVGGWKSSTPLAGDDWAANIMSHIREFGANVILHGQLTDYSWQDLELTKAEYDEFAAYQKEYCAKGRWNPPIPEWSPERFNGSRFRKMSDTAHRQGLAVMAWNGTVPGVKGYGDLFDEKEFDVGMKIQALFPKVGQDSVFSGLTGNECPDIPKELIQKNGGQRNYWLWKNPCDFFKSRRQAAQLMKRLYDYSHKVAPDAPVMNFMSDNGELAREMCLAYEIGTLDTMLNEFVSHLDFTKTKHTAKRLRAFFDNEDGRTIWHHHYFMNFEYDNRIGNAELPFVCGINGFSQESMTYENFHRDAFDIMGDFNRFAFHTQLGPKAAKMGPVRNLAVLRDMRCFEEDILKRRYTNRGWWQASLYDLRVNSFAEALNYNYDIVLDPFCKRDSLARYKAVYVPDDDVLSEELAKEILFYVKAGGGAVFEGAAGDGNKVMQCLALKDGEVKELGKGKAVWTKAVLTDRMIRGDAKAIARMKELVASVGGVETHTITGSKTLDSVLQASKEGMLLGVYNRGMNLDSGKVEIRGLAQKPRSTKGGDVFVLDVKAGKRFAYTNGFEIAVGPWQCGFYLIGDDAFTAIPKATEVTWAGPSAMVFRPQGAPMQKPDDPGFKPHACVELATASIRRSEENGIRRTQFSFADEEKMPKGMKPYSVKAFVKALKDADYLHLQAPADELDAVFADCADDMKAFLSHGGGILFDRYASIGKNAEKFLADVGVDNPYANAVLRKKEWDDNMVWNEAMTTNHPFVTTAPKGEQKTLFGQVGGHELAFTGWNMKKQDALYLVSLDHAYATVLVQDNVLGRGKVVFNTLSRSFNDWYENKAFGNAILSLLIGMPTDMHKKKAEAYTGGPGEEVK